MPSRQLAHRAFDLGVALVADHDELVALACASLATSTCTLVTSGQVASKTWKPRARASCAHRLADAVRAEHQRGAGRHVGQVFDEDRALGLQVVDDVGVVHDLVAHVDRRAELRSARSTISIARSTPAQKPRGSASMTSLEVVAGVHHSTPISCDFEGHGLAGQRMVEVEQQRSRRRRSRTDAGVAGPAVGRRELHHVADRVVARRGRPCCASSERATRCSSSGLRSPKASPARELERSRARPRPGPSRRCSIAGASSPVPSDSVAGLSPKVLIDVGAVGAGQPVVQGQEGPGLRRGFTAVRGGAIDSSRF